MRQLLFTIFISKMEYKDLIEGFAEKYGVEVQGSTEGGVTFVIDYTAVTIREASNVTAIIVTSVIGGPVPDEKGRLASFMLQANYLFSMASPMTICQNPETNEYLLEQFIPRGLADVESLSKTVEELVDMEEKLRDSLAAFLDVDRESEQKDEAEMELNPLFGGFFIRV